MLNALPSLTVSPPVAKFGFRLVVLLRCGLDALSKAELQSVFIHDPGPP